MDGRIKTGIKFGFVENFGGFGREFVVEVENWGNIKEFVGEVEDWEIWKVGI